MKQIIKVIAWIAGIVSAIVLFAEPTAELFPAQIVAGGIIYGIFWLVKRQAKEAYHEA
jgi:hypothetical protein